MNILRCLHFLLFVKLVKSVYNIDDELAYKIVWGDSEVDFKGIATQKSVILSTSVGEEFDCVFPSDDGYKPKKKQPSNVTDSEGYLLRRLVKFNPCSTRSELYWSYEICHAKYVRQFHEELLPDQSSVLQEYFLGYFPEGGDYGLESMDSKPSEILLGDTSYPYVKYQYVNGTSCDLTLENRRTSVLYICLEGENGRIVQVSETESCQYQVVFATRFLCENPAYTISKRSTIPVSCKPRSGSPLKPSSLLEYEKEQKELNRAKLPNLAMLFGNSELKNLQIETERTNNMIIYRIRSLDSNVQTEETQVDDDEQSSVNTEKDDSHRGDAHQESTEPHSPSDVHEAASRAANKEQFFLFLRGHFCLTGQTAGWWMHEICFKKNVTQYHINETGHRVQAVLLGLWDPEAHQTWLEHRSSKVKLQSQNSQRYDLLYDEGDYCQQINDNRQAVVKLRCDRSARGIYLSFSEQSLCRYSVLIETSAFCDLPVDTLSKLLL